MSDEQRAGLQDSCAAVRPSARSPSPSRLAHPRLRRRLRQGRRRQVVGHGQPRRGAWPREGLQGRRRRRRHLRPLDPAHARRRRTPPTQVEDMIMPPSAHGVKVISIGMFTAGNAPVVWRGPMLHRALQQFLADVYWGDLDVLLLDLPPGTGDIAISLGQLLPSAELARRHHAAAGRRRGGRARRHHRPADTPAHRRRHREHGLACPARTAANAIDVFGVRRRRAGGGRAEPCSGRRCPCSAASRSTCGSVRAVTPGVRSCSTTRVPRRCRTPGDRRPGRVPAPGAGGDEPRRHPGGPGLTG